MNISVWVFDCMDFYEFSLLLFEYLKDKENEINFERAKYGQKPIQKFNSPIKGKKQTGDGYALMTYLNGR